MMKTFFLTLFFCVSQAVSGDVTIIGHRGSPCSAPENTLASFRGAIEAKADFIEFDVHLTRDNVPIVVHDPLLGRTVNFCYPICVNSLTIKQIKKYDAGILFGDTFKNEAIPTLEEVFDLVDGQVGMMIEIKTGSAPDARLAEEVMKVVKNKKKGAVIIASFSAAVLQRVRELEPNQQILGLAEYVDELESHYVNHPEYLGLKYTLITPELVNLSHKEGRKVWVWTVNTEDLKQYLIPMGIDGLITNRPMALR